MGRYCKITTLILFTSKNHCCSFKIEFCRCRAEKPNAESLNYSWNCSCKWLLASQHIQKHPSLILPPRTPSLCCLTIKPNGHSKRVSADKTSKCTQQVWSFRGKDRQMLQLRTAIRHWRRAWLNLLKLPLCACGICVRELVFCLCVRVFTRCTRCVCVCIVILPSSPPGKLSG